MTVAQTTAGAHLPDHADVAFHPPILMLVGLILGFTGRWLLAPLEFLPQTVATLLGPLVVIVSFGCFLWAAITMRRAGASIPTGEPTEAIAVQGPYRWSRNPIYASMVALQVGVGIWSNSGWFLLFGALSAGLLWWGVISREERYLERKLWPTYLAYKAHVRRWI